MVEAPPLSTPLTPAQIYVVVAFFVLWGGALMLGASCIVVALRDRRLSRPLRTLPPLLGVLSYILVALGPGELSRPTHLEALIAMIAVPSVLVLCAVLLTRQRQQRSEGSG